MKFSIPNPGRFPERITLELANRCNMSCTFCPRRIMKGHEGFLDTKLAKRFIDEIAENLPVTLVPFFRGESLLHPEWLNILSYAKHKGLGPIQLATNATLMDQIAAEAILDLGLDFISFSMDTSDPDIYHRTRRGANYQEVVKNILFLLELKERRGLNLPETQVSAVETPAHRPGMAAFIAFWKPKVDRVRIYIEHSRDGHAGSIAEPLPDFDTRLPCRKVFTDMVIYWDGEVATCNHDWTRDASHRMGNVKDKDIAAVWQSDRYQAIREAHKKGELSGEPPCDFCDHWKMHYLPEGYLGTIYARAKSKDSVTF